MVVLFFVLCLRLRKQRHNGLRRLKDRMLLCSLAGLLAGFVQTGDIWVYEAGRKRIESFRCHATELITTERVQNSPNPSRQMCPTRVIACTNPMVGGGQWRHLDYLDVSAEAAELDRNLRCSTPRVRDEEKKIGCREPTEKSRFGGARAQGPATSSKKAAIITRGIEGLILQYPVSQSWTSINSV